jgi:hypothetical protein
MCNGNHYLSIVRIDDVNDHTSLDIYTSLSNRYLFLLVYYPVGGWSPTLWSPTLLQPITMLLNLVSLLSIIFFSSLCSSSRVFPDPRMPECLKTRWYRKLPGMLLLKLLSWKTMRGEAKVTSESLLHHSAKWHRAENTHCFFTSAFLTLFRFVCNEWQYWATCLHQVPCEAWLNQLLKPLKCCVRLLENIL